MGLRWLAAHARGSAPSVAPPAPQSPRAALIHACRPVRHVQVTANVGDARILLIRNGQAVVLTEEHVPDM